jgi:hypothetical protein
VTRVWVFRRRREKAKATREKKNFLRVARVGAETNRKKAEATRWGRVRRVPWYDMVAVIRVVPRCAYIVDFN